MFILDISSIIISQGETDILKEFKNVDQSNNVQYKIKYKNEEYYLTLNENEGKYYFSKNSYIYLFDRVVKISYFKTSFDSCFENLCKDISKACGYKHLGDKNGRRYC